MGKMHPTLYFNSSLNFSSSSIPLNSEQNNNSPSWFDRLQNQMAKYDELNEITETDDIQSLEVINPEPEKLEEILEPQSSLEENNNQLVEALVKRSNRCIISISSGNSWSLFPSTIKVEESRVTFIFRQLFTSQSHSVDIKDISNVFIESSLFTASLEIVSKTYVQNDTKITNLNKKKAMKVRMIIEGLRTLNEYNINTAGFTVQELLSKIEAMHSNN